MFKLAPVLLGNRWALFVGNFTYLLTYFMEKGPSGEATSLQVVKKFPAFYGT
jgi:hypothetical protein